MKKWLPFALIIFGFNQIGFAAFHENQTSLEINPDSKLDSVSISQKPLDLLDYEGFNKNSSNTSASSFEKQFSLPETKYFAELKLNQESYPVSISNDVSEEVKASVKKNNRTEEFNLGNGFTIIVPFWVVGVFALFVIYTIFISLRFLSIYFQEVSTQEQLEVITGDFDSYKRNTIEKERKLMRDLIDAKNRIHDLSQEVRN